MEVDALDDLLPSSAVIILIIEKRRSCWNLIIGISPTVPRIDYSFKVSSDYFSYIALKAIRVKIYLPSIYDASELKRYFRELNWHIKRIRLINILETPEVPLLSNLKEGEGERGRLFLEPERFIREKPWDTDQRLLGILKYIAII